MERTEVAMLWLHVGAIWFLPLIGNAVAGNKSTECVWGWDCKASGGPGVSDLFGNLCWAGGRSEDCVSCRQGTQTNSFHPVLAPAQPAGEGAPSPPLDALAVWKSPKTHGCDHGTYPCCGLVFPGAVELVQSQQQDQPPLLRLEQGCQSWHHRPWRDQKSLLVLEPQLSLGAHTCAKTHPGLHLLVSCSADCCFLNQVQQLWTLPASLCSGSNCPGHCWLSIPHCRIFLMLRGKEELSKKQLIVA